MNHLLLKRNELVSIAVAVFLLLAIGVFTAADWIGSRQNRSEAAAARQTLEDLNAFLLSTTAAETGQRGYLLTGEDSYLEPYREAARTIPSQLARLGSDASADTGIQDRVARLRSLTGEKLAELRKTVDARRRGDLAGSIRTLNSGRGADLMQAIRESAAALRADVQREVDNRSQLVRANSDRAHAVIVTGCMVLLALLALGAVNISQAAAKRDELIASLDREQRAASDVRDMLKTTLFSIGDAVLVTDREGLVTYVNPVAQSLTGWNEQDASGRPAAEVFRIVSEATKQAVESPLETVLRTGSAQGLANHTVLIARDGREIPIDDSGAPIFGPDRSVLGVVLVFRDITNRRAAERERERLLVEAENARRDAERQRSHLHSLFLQAPASINIYRGPEHVFELVHPLAKEYFGRDVTGMRASEVHLPELVRILDEVYRSGEPRNLHELKLRGVGPGASPLYVNYFCRPWRDAGGAMAGVMTLGLDVTEQVALKDAMRVTEERLRETAKLESLGVLAGGIAHDFNNLLVGIIGNASLVLEALPPESAEREMARGVLDAGERAAVLTRQMLAYSGKGKFVVEFLNVSDLVSDLLPLLRSSVPRTVTLRTETAGGLPAIEADGAQIQQIFMNLVINGAEACAAAGTVTVRTGIEEITAAGAPLGTFGLDAPEPGTYVLLEVADTGSGMTEETKRRIFDPFFTTKFTGRGLGLSAVLGIIRAHKGAIEVESAPGRGSTFRVLLPAAEGAVRDARGALAPARVIGGSGTVLVIDDEPLVRGLGRAALERMGYGVVEAEDGEEAVAMLLAGRDEVDLAILDLTMPVLSGAETLRELRRLRPRLPVILSSGFSETEARLRLRGEQLSGFLQKPYTASQLADAVRKALSGAHSSAAG